MKMKFKNPFGSRNKGYSTPELGADTNVSSAPPGFKNASCSEPTVSTRPLGLKIATDEDTRLERVDEHVIASPFHSGKHMPSPIISVPIPTDGNYSDSSNCLSPRSPRKQGDEKSTNVDTPREMNELEEDVAVLHDSASCLSRHLILPDISEPVLKVNNTTNSEDNSILLQQQGDTITSNHRNNTTPNRHNNAGSFPAFQQEAAILETWVNSWFSFWCTCGGCGRYGPNSNYNSTGMDTMNEVNMTTMITSHDRAQGRRIDVSRIMRPCCNHVEPYDTPRGNAIRTSHSELRLGPLKEDPLSSRELQNASDAAFNIVIQDPAAVTINRN